jgi:glucose-6-phosphate isomerase
MTIREPITCEVDVLNGRLLNSSGAYIKKLSDLEGLYADSQAFAERIAHEAESIVYDVTEQRPTHAVGDLIFGVTRMSPGKIGNEFFITRGHIHARADRPEIYFGQSGRGVMLMESPDGETRTVEISAQTICYVPPYWIHRSVNVGDEDLVMLFAYPTDAGQDYDIIARSGGMRTRIIDDGKGGWMTVENTDYRPRNQEQITHIFQLPAAR